MKTPPQFRESSVACSQMCQGDKVKKMVFSIMRAFDTPRGDEMEHLCHELQAEFSRDENFTIVGRLCQYGRADIIEQVPYLLEILKQCSRIRSNGYSPICKAMWPKRGVANCKVLYTIRCCMRQRNFSPLFKNAKEESVVRSLYNAHQSRYISTDVYKMIYWDMMECATDTMKRVALVLVNKLGTNTPPWHICWVLTLEDGIDRVVEAVYDQLTERTRLSRPGRLGYISETREAFQSAMTFFKDDPMTNMDPEFRDFFRRHPWTTEREQCFWTTLLDYFMLRPDLDALEKERIENGFMNPGAAVMAMIGELHDTSPQQVSVFVHGLAPRFPTLMMWAIHHSKGKIWSKEMEDLYTKMRPQKFCSLQVDVDNLLGAVKKS